MIRHQLKALVCVAIVTTLGFVIGCTGGEEEGGEKRFLQLGTAPVGGAFNVVGGAIAEVVEEDRPEGMGKLSAKATKGSQENIRALDDGSIDFALANAAISYFAVRGEGAWDKKYDIKTIMTLAPNVAMFVTTKGSGIETIADLKGKKVTIGPAGAGFEYFVGPLLEAHGLTLEAGQDNSIVKQNATQSQAVDLLGDGATDAAFLGGAVPTSSLVQACSTLDVVFIPFDPAVKEKLIADYQFFEPFTIAKEKYSDLTGEFEGMNVGAMHLVTSGAQDEELIYNFTKTVYERREKVAAKHPAGKAINPKNVVKGTGVEFHPGAIRYYKEIGIWPEEGDEGAAKTKKDE